MPTAPTKPSPKASPQAPPQDKFSYAKTSTGDVTLLTLRGTLDHDFEGRKIAGSIHTKKLIVNMREVRRFASWGMSEWMDFLKINADRDLYLIEGDTYAVSQMNLVTGLIGHAKLVSFYAPYRCGSCSEEFDVLILIPRERESIRDLPASHQECKTCGSRARLEEYPAAFFETVADRPPFDIDDEVLTYLRSSLDYDLPVDLTRFRAYRRQRKGYTYLRLSGNIASLPPDVLAKASAGSTVVDLENVTFDPSNVTQWQAFVSAARPKLTSLQLLSCPPGFIDTAVRPEDLRDKLKVRTCALAYDCPRCKTTFAQMVDVAENLEQLVGGAAPQASCPTCKASVVATLSSEQSTRLRMLPARDRDAALDTFLAKAHSEPVEKLEDVLALPAKRLPDAGAPRRGRAIALALTALLLVGMAVVGVVLWKGRTENPPAAGTQTPAVATPQPPPGPTFERPDWIMSDVPSSAYCHDMINRLLCVGVSSYRPTRDEAVGEANAAALEELVSAVGLKITDAYFRDNVISTYSNARATAMSALQAAEFDRASPAYVAADEVVRTARKRVVEILQLTGGPAVPAQRTDWYWEEYVAKSGAPEVLVFVRYDVSLDAVKALVDKYSATSPVMDSMAMTAFPALAWQHGDFTGGLLVTKAGRSLADGGIARHDLVMAVGEHRIGDAASFARRVEEAKGDLKLTVKSGDKPARVVEVRRRGK